MDSKSHRPPSCPASKRVKHPLDTRLGPSPGGCGPGEEGARPESHLGVSHGGRLWGSPMGEERVRGRGWGRSLENFHLLLGSSVMAWGPGPRGGRVSEERRWSTSCPMCRSSVCAQRGHLCPLTRPPRSQDKGPWEEGGACCEWAAGQLNRPSSEQAHQQLTGLQAESPQHVGGPPWFPGCSPVLQACRTDVALGFLMEPACWAVLTGCPEPAGHVRPAWTPQGEERWA